jgi:hypothetical protein
VPSVDSLGTDLPDVFVYADKRSGISELVFDFTVAQEHRCQSTGSAARRSFLASLPRLIRIRTLVAMEAATDSVALSHRADENVVHIELAVTSHGF